MLIKKLILKLFLQEKVKKPINKKEINKILFIRNLKIGDAVVSFPLLRELKKNFPNAEIDVYASTNSDFLFKDSYFISQKLDYLYTIREPLRDINFEDRDIILKGFVAFTYNLHKNGVYHKDYSAGNILVFKNNDNYDFSIVDINRMEFKEIDLTTGLDNFAKLWLDENSLDLIAKEYAKLSETNEVEAIKILRDCDKKLKSFVEFKRKIRGRNN